MPFYLVDYDSNIRSKKVAYPRALYCARSLEYGCGRVEIRFAVLMPTVTISWFAGAGWVRIGILFSSAMC